MSQHAATLQVGVLLMHVASLLLVAETQQLTTYTETAKDIEEERHE